MCIYIYIYIYTHIYIHTYIYIYIYIYKGEYGRETEAIEDAYTEERQSTIGEYGSEIDSMFDHRRGKEVFYKEAKQKREDQYQREIEDLITKGADQYNKLKIDLEKNIQTLKEQLEEIRATYQLNTEKLDYNYRVLTELDVEKNAELARYKRRLAKLKDQMNQLVTRYSDMEGADTKTNNDLTDDYRSLTQKYKELQAKFRHFEVADSNKYDDVWAMHEEEVKSLVDQLLKADKIIAEQQLGWQWKVCIYTYMNMYMYTFLYIYMYIYIHIYIYCCIYTYTYFIHICIFTNICI
jgi:dynein regulatory complex protein 1